MISSYWKKLNRRDRKAVVIGMIAVCGIIGIWAVLSLSETQQATREQIAVKRSLFEKQLSRIAEKENIAKQLEVAQANLKQLEDGTLPGDTPPVAAAELQSALKEIAMSVGIDIAGEKALPASSAGAYQSIPVEVNFIASTQKLRDMLTRLDAAPLHLAVLDFKIQTLSGAASGEQSVTMKVAALWKKGARIPLPAAPVPPELPAPDPLQPAPVQPQSQPAAQPQQQNLQPAAGKKP